MQIVGGELYCEIFFQMRFFPYFFIFSKPFNLKKKLIIYVQLFLILIILNALLNPY